jgi:hypothetical protein
MEKLGMWVFFFVTIGAALIAWLECMAKIS